MLQRMVVAEPIQKLTEAEYLALERRAEFKSEFLDGDMFAMAGGTQWHSLIAVGLATEFGNQRRGRAWVVYGSDLRLKVEATGLLTYPDLSVVCGPPRFLDTEVDTLLNPTLIAEVLSDSTEAYDRGRKVEHYRQIPSLKEYLLVGQREPRVKQLIRQQGGQVALARSHRAQRHPRTAHARHRPGGERGLRAGRVHAEPDSAPHLRFGFHSRTHAPRNN